jgi:hypothetical protein
MGLALPCMRVGAATPRLAEAPARDGILQLQRRAAPRQLRRLEHIYKTGRLSSVINLLLGDKCILALLNRVKFLRV